MLLRRATLSLLRHPSETIPALRRKTGVIFSIWDNEHVLLPGPLNRPPRGYMSEASREMGR